MTENHFPLNLISTVSSRNICAYSISFEKPVVACSAGGDKREKSTRRALDWKRVRLETRETWNTKTQVRVFSQRLARINLNAKNYYRILFSEGCVFGTETYSHNLATVVFHSCWEDKPEEATLHYRDIRTKRKGWSRNRFLVCKQLDRISQNRHHNSNKQERHSLGEDT